MVLVPQIDIEKTRGAITEVALKSPSRKMFEILMKSVDLMMDDMVEARDSLQGFPKIEKDLATWDEAFMQFGERDAWYVSVLDSDADKEEIKFRVEDPLLRGKYPDDTPSPPDWPDVETPWRMMNDIALMGAKARRPQSFFDELEQRWKANFSRYWKTNALRLSMHAKKLEGGSGDAEGVTFSSTGAGDRIENYRAAADDSASFAQRANDFFSAEKWESFKKTSKNVGIGVAVGAVVTLLLVVRRR